MRLFGKPPDLYGSRLFDILLLDALYAQAPVLKLAERSGWDLVISLKQNQRDLYQSAIRLFAAAPPISTVPSGCKEKAISSSFGIRKGYHSPPITRSPCGSCGPKKSSRRLGHDRWKQENNSWNDLTQNWAFKHGFLHACRHRPQTHNAEGERKPVANRGLAAVAIIMLLAFTLCSAFIQCHSKIFRRYPTSTLEVAHQLRSSLSKLPPNIRAPDAPAAVHSA